MQNRVQYYVNSYLWQHFEDADAMITYNHGNYSWAICRANQRLIAGVLRMSWGQDHLLFPTNKALYLEHGSLASWGSL